MLFYIFVNHVYGRAVHEPRREVSWSGGYCDSVKVQKVAE